MLNTNISRKLSLVGLAAFMATTLGQGVGLASVKGTRNTAIAVTAGSLFEFATGHPKTGLVLGAGAAYAWKKNSDSRKAHRHIYRKSHRRAHHVYYRHRAK
jgi:hypothetical protein